MIEWVVLIILIVFIAYLLFTLTTYIALGVNIVLLIVLAILLKGDLRRKEMTRHYLIALLLTAIVFIFSQYGIFYTLLRIMSNNLLLSVVTEAFLMLYVFANLSFLITNSAKDIRKKYK